MINAKAHLMGYLGEDAKPVTKDGKNFTVLKVATNDSYPVKEGEITKWKKKETVWHDVLVFNPSASRFANELKKGDKVEVSGPISYRNFKDEKGFNRPQATIIGDLISKIEYAKKETKKIVEEVVESLTT